MIIEQLKILLLDKGMSKKEIDLYLDFNNTKNKEKNKGEGNYNHESTEILKNRNCLHVIEDDNCTTGLKEIEEEKDGKDVKENEMEEKGVEKEVEEERKDNDDDDDADDDDDQLEDVMLDNTAPSLPLTTTTTTAAAAAGGSLNGNMGVRAGRTTAVCCDNASTPTPTPTPTSTPTSPPTPIPAHTTTTADTIISSSSSSSPFPASHPFSSPASYDGIVPPHVAQHTAQHTYNSESIYISDQTSAQSSSKRNSTSSDSCSSAVNHIHVPTVDSLSPLFKKTGDTGSTVSSSSSIPCIRTPIYTTSQEGSAVKSGDHEDRKVEVQGGGVGGEKEGGGEGLGGDDDKKGVDELIGEQNGTVKSPDTLPVLTDNGRNGLLRLRSVDLLSALTAAADNEGESRLFGSPRV